MLTHHLIRHCQHRDRLFSRRGVYRDRCAPKKRRLPAPHQIQKPRHIGRRRMMIEKRIHHRLHFPGLLPRPRQFTQGGQHQPRVQTRVTIRHPQQLTIRIKTQRPVQSHPWHQRTKRPHKHPKLGFICAGILRRKNIGQRIKVRIPIPRPQQHAFTQHILRHLRILDSSRAAKSHRLKWKGHIRGRRNADAAFRDRKLIAIRQIPQPILRQRQVITIDH